MVQFSGVMSEMPEGTYGKNSLNTETEKSEQTLFAKTFLSQY